MSYLSLTDADREQMLAAIGVSSIDELFRDIPAGMRFDRELDLEGAGKRLGDALGEAERPPAADGHDEGERRDGRAHHAALAR